MSTKTQGNYPGDWLKEEFGAPNYCREEVTVLSGQNLVSGTVVAKVTASGKYVAFDDDSGTGGVETAAGILLHDVDASSADTAGVIIKRGPCVVSKAGLTWESSNDAGEKANGLADLLTLGIVAREGV